MTPIEIVHNALILALSGVCWFGVWLNWQWQAVVKKIQQTANECLDVNVEQSKHIADLQRRVHAAYAVLVSVAHAPLSADDKVAMVAAFLQDEGVSGTAEVRVEAPQPPAIH